jgi:NTE family protein
MADTPIHRVPLNTGTSGILGHDGPAEASEIIDAPAATLSGGGYRAMMFHLGFLWRLRDAGMLEGIKRFSSVSGGSITAGALAVAWDRIDFADDGASFRTLVAEPLFELSRHSIQYGGVLLGQIPGLSGEYVRKAYDKHVFKGAKLSSLPPGRRFVFNATSMHTGKLVRFNNEWFGEWSTGRWEVGELSLATAVTASSAFPPVLAPVIIDLAGHRVVPSPGTRHDPPPKLYTMDGGVYDNLGIEAVWKRFSTVYVSDAGAAFNYEAEGHRFMPGVAMRVTDLMMDQIASLRFRQMHDGFEAAPGTSQHRSGFLVSSDYFLDPRPAGGLPYIREAAQQLAALPTRLKAYSPREACGLVNWGYIATDDQLRAKGPVSGKCDLPYPEYPV